MKQGSKRAAGKPAKTGKPLPVRPAVLRDRLWVLLIFVLTFALYANTLPNGYLMDDFSVLSENFVVKRGVEGIPTILSTPYRYGFNLLSDNGWRRLGGRLDASRARSHLAQVGRATLPAPGPDRPRPAMPSPRGPFAAAQSRTAGRSRHLLPRAGPGPRP